MILLQLFHLWNYRQQLIWSRSQKKIRKNNEIIHLDKIRTVIFIKSEVQLSGSPLSKAAEAHTLPSHVETQRQRQTRVRQHLIKKRLIEPVLGLV